MNALKLKEAKEFRCELGAMILLDMENNDELPLPNMRRVIIIMQEYAKRKNKIIKVAGYKWRPTELYWWNHLDDVRRTLREKKEKYFEFLRTEGSLRGVWKFVSKEEYQDILKRDYKEVGTRTDTYNNKLDASKWKLPLPHIKDVPLLGSIN